MGNRPLIMIENNDKKMNGIKVMILIFIVSLFSAYYAPKEKISNPRK